MRVEEYIKQLLYRYDCVIVPGFGAFVIQKSPTVYQPHKHRFTPPYRKVTFNKAIQNHDGLLAETIAKGESMDFESAKHKIQLFINDFESALKVDRSIKIPELGKFSLNDENKLSFEPYSNINYFLDSFGLDELSLDQVSEPVIEKEDAVDKQVEVKSLEQKTLEGEELEHVNSKEEGRRSYFRYAAVGIIALGIASFAGLYQYNNYVISHNDSEAQKAESLLQEKIQNAEFNYTLTELPLDATLLEAVKPKYHIIAGAFRVEANALKKIELLKEKGYNASSIGENSYGLHQVVFSSFISREEALAQLRKIKAIENPDAWLYVKQL